MDGRWHFGERDKRRVGRCPVCARVELLFIEAYSKESSR